MQHQGRWWDRPLSKGVSSLLIALSVAFLPLWIDQVRARRSAKPIEIVAYPPPAARLSYEARAEVTKPASDSIRVTVVIANTGADSARTLVSQHCPVLFQLRAASDSTRRPRWDGGKRECPAGGREVELGPGQMEVLRTTASIQELLGDSLPDGRYVVAAIVGVHGDTMARHAGEVVLRRRTR